MNPSRSRPKSIAAWAILGGLARRAFAAAARLAACRGAYLGATATGCAHRPPRAPESNHAMPMPPSQLLHAIRTGLLAAIARSVRSSRPIDPRQPTAGGSSSVIIITSGSSSTMRRAAGAGAPAQARPAVARGAAALVAALGLLLGLCCRGAQAFVPPSAARPVAAPRGRSELAQPPTQTQQQAQQVEGSAPRRGGYGRQSVIMMPSAEPAVRARVSVWGCWAVGREEGAVVGVCSSWL